MNGAEVGDLFMSLTHTCELNESQVVRLSHRVAAAPRGTQAEPLGVDALELRRDLGSTRYNRRRII